MNNFIAARLSHRTLVLLFIALLAVGAAAWLSRYFEWQEEEIDLGPSDAASNDQFLAAQKFLALQGVRAQTLRSFSLLDTMNWQSETLTANDTIVLLNAHKLLRSQRLEKLLDWVASGGTVIASTGNPFIGNNTDTRDLLLDHFELELIRFESEDSDEGTDINEQNIENESSTDDETTHEENSPEEKTTADYMDRCTFQSEIVDIEFAGEAAPLHIDYSGGNSFDFYGEEPEHWSGNEEGLHLAIFSLGNGRVIINSDNQIWSNLRIDCHDHAYALWKLINAEGKVWFLVNQEAPSLWALLWRAAPFGALTALLALVLWLWAKASRFGPILSRPVSGRRSLGEHVHASAALLWRRQQHPHLIKLLRDELRDKLQQRLPQFDHWPRSEQIAHLQTLTRLSANELEHALFSDQLQSPRDFTLVVASLQKIRKHL